MLFNKVRADRVNQIAEDYCVTVSWILASHALHLDSPEDRHIYKNYTGSNRVWRKIIYPSTQIDTNRINTALFSKNPFCLEHTRERQIYF